MDVQIKTKDNSSVMEDETIPDVSIILVCWNNRNYLRPCLKSLYDGCMHSSFEVVVVDNGSNDGSQAMLCEEFPQVKCIQNDHNVGLSKASNQGIVATAGRYVLLLNNDTLVNCSCIDAMIEFMDANPEIGAVGGKLLNPDGSFQGGCAEFSTLQEEFLIATRLGEIVRKGYPSHGNPSQAGKVGWLSSACLLIRRKALDQVGLLDEEYFIYGDEVDLQYRLNKAGWQVYYLPDVTTIHFGGRSMDRWRRRKMVYRGKMLFYKKNYGLIRMILLRTMFAGLSLCKLCTWLFVYLVPQRRAQAQLELKSNFEVLQLCLKLV